MNPKIITNPNVIFSKYKARVDIAPKPKNTPANGMVQQSPQSAAVIHPNVLYFDKWFIQLPHKKF